jgi:hypothetical protein
MKILTNIDVNGNQILNLVLQILASDPGSPTEGQIWYNSTSHKFKARTNGSTIEFASVAELSSYITASSTNTLTNKTFDAEGAGNSLSNVSVSNLKNGVLITSTSLAGAADTNIPSTLAVKTYIDNAVLGIDWKESVRAATTANGVLANAYANGQVIDGITLATGDRILLKDQSAAAENGIYIVQAAGAPVRATDADSGNDVWNAAVYVREGTTNANTSWVNSNATLPTINVTSLTFAQLSGATTPDATTTTKGKVELATQAETEARTDNVRVVTPDTLINFGKRFTANIGDGASTSIDVTHNLGTKDTVCEVYTVADDTKVICEVTHLSTTATRFIFAVAPTSNQYRVVIFG